MPLHMTGFVSRRGLDHPEEQPKIPKVPFELVLKGGKGGPGYNPYRAKSGLFTSSGGGEPTGAGGKALAEGKTDTGQVSGGSGGGGGGEKATHVGNFHPDHPEALYDPELSDKHMAGFSTDDGEQFYKKRSELPEGHPNKSESTSQPKSVAVEPAAVKPASKPKQKAGTLNPDETSAEKMLNHLKKAYGAEAGYHGTSNPYSSHQHRQAHLTPEKAKQLAKDLEEAGWKKNSGNVAEAYKHRVFNFDNKHDAGMRVDIEDGRVSIYGLKKAKPTTIPYYD